MFNEENEIKGVCCFDCAMIEAGGQIGPFQDGWDTPRRQMALISAINYHIVVGDKVEDFSTKMCEVCMTSLAGERYNVSMWEYPED